ncbi:VOC family protein [Corynebacterium heidelbergense]|uniref:Glyoxalase n=1 Tax=Corynebacterium heidelbergense TaxID=2055947 RepID=A0A364V5J3_9CORY|nr:VOC family protein [Corynebacterium heidelbergense]RAV31888.1 glyoxalase [Corynebacterium heidelbergense]
MPAIIAEPGMPIWVDLATTDVARVKPFYQRVFGWDYRQEGPGYTVALRDGMPVAGIAEVPEGSSPIWGLSLYAPDVQQAHDAAVEHGANSVLAPENLGDRGSMALVVDPAGAAVGLKCPLDEHALVAAGEPGTPVWFELLVGSKWDETVEFYHLLTGWDMRVVSDDEGFRYVVGEIEGAGVAGLWDTKAQWDEHDPSTEGPAMWTVYLGVPDLQEALEAVRETGGSVVREAWEAEFGRLATVEDPSGALFNVCEVAEYDPSADEVHEPDLLAPED